MFSFIAFGEELEKPILRFWLDLAASIFIGNLINWIRTYSEL